MTSTHECILEECAIGRIYLQESNRELAREIRRLTMKCSATNGAGVL